jgi:hypothetical protein
MLWNGQACCQAAFLCVGSTTKAASKYCSSEGSSIAIVVGGAAYVLRPSPPGIWLYNALLAHVPGTSVRIVGNSEIWARPAVGGLGTGVGIPITSDIYWLTLRRGKGKG